MAELACALRPGGGLDVLPPPRRWPGRHQITLLHRSAERVWLCDFSGKFKVVCFIVEEWWWYVMVKEIIYDEHFKGESHRGWSPMAGHGSLGSLGAVVSRVLRFGTPPGALLRRHGAVPSSLLKDLEGAKKPIAGRDLLVFLHLSCLFFD